MRIFLFINNVNNIAPSSYLQDGITAHNYKFLNFAGSEIVDAANIKYRYDKIEPEPQDGSKPFAPNRWYMLQYEMAYDPELVATTLPNPPQFSFYANAINIDSVKLGGTQQGTLKGTIGSSSSSNLFSTITNSLAKPLGTGIIAAIGNQFLAKHNKEDGDGNVAIIPGSNDLGLPEANFSSISKGVSNALSTASGSLPGSITNVLSAVIGGNSASNQRTISLNLSTTISLKGSMSSNSNFIAPTSFYMPGSIKPDDNGQYNVQNYIPLYNKPLGVFNISNTPKVIREIQDNYAVGFTDKQPCYSINYYIDLYSFKLNWNPEVLKEATIKNIHYEFFFYGVRSAEKTENLPTEYLPSTDGFRRKYFVESYPNSCLLYDYPSYWERENPFIRISFNVVPKNGAPTVTIVKTFKAEYEDIFGIDYYPLPFEYLP
jgi:hypothetical protein